MKNLKEHVEKLIVDEKLMLNLPFDNKALELAIAYGYNLAKKETDVDSFFKFLEENLIGYNISGTLQGAITDRDLSRLKEKFKKEIDNK